MIIPKSLSFGSHIRVIAPSLSMHILSQETIRYAQRRFQDMGFSVSFGKHVFEYDQFNSSGIQSRIDDLHEAFADSKVDAVVSVLGGFNANQLLPYIDFNLIVQNPKIVCGYSDNTILLNAIFHKTGLLTWYGSHFATFGQKNLDLYEMQYFFRALTAQESVAMNPAHCWSHEEHNKKISIKNDGYWIIQKGYASGLSVGGHLGTFNLLQGTEWMPSLQGKILIIEEDMSSGNAVMFDRMLQSVLHQKDAHLITGILIGRFEKNYEINKELLTVLCTTKSLAKTIPIIANVDFGHTEPRCTLPIGGKITIDATDTDVTLTIL